MKQPNDYEFDYQIENGYPNDLVRNESLISTSFISIQIILTFLERHLLGAFTNMRESSTIGAKTAYG